MKYKVGDTVKIRGYLVVNKAYGADTFVKGMKKYLGKETTVVDVDNYIHSYGLNIDNEEWSWTDEMLESND